MRVLILNWRDLSHPRAGGAEVFTHEVARRWVAAGHEVTLFCATVSGRPSADERDGVHIVRRGGRHTVYREARRYVTLEANGAFDFIIDEVNTRPFMSPKWAGTTPIVALIHQVCREIWWYDAPLPVAIAGRFYFEAHWLRAYRKTPVLTVSPSSRESLVRYGLSDVTVIPEGVDGAPSSPSEKELRPTIVFVGRLAANKRPRAAIKAFHLLRQDLPDAQMWIVGDGPQRGRLVRGAGEGVTFVGRVSEGEKVQLLSRAHALVVTSVREGWGLVVDEAARVGTPTIGYDVAGLRDSIPAARGTLVRPNPRALADELFDALPRLVSAPARTGWRGGATDWDTVADRVLAECIARATPALPTAGEGRPQ